MIERGVPNQVQNRERFQSQASWSRQRTLFKLLEAFKGNLKLVLVGELGGVVDNLDAKERNDRHSAQKEYCACEERLEGKRR